MAALQYYEEVVTKVLAPHLRCCKDLCGSPMTAGGASSISKDNRANGATPGLVPGISSPLDEDGLRVFVAQNMLEELRGPGDRMLKRLHRTVESFLGLDLPNPLAERGLVPPVMHVPQTSIEPSSMGGGVGKSDVNEGGGQSPSTGGGGGGAGNSAAAVSASITNVVGEGADKEGPVFVMSEDLRVGFRVYLTQQVQLTEENAGACVLKVDQAMRVVLERDGPELLLKGEETVLTAEQLGSVVMHFYEPLALYLAEEHLAWAAQHLRRYASNGGVRGRVLDGLLRDSFCSWLVRQRHVQDARAAAVWVEELEGLLRPFLRRSERHIGVDRTKDVMRKNMAFVTANTAHVEERHEAQEDGDIEDSILSPVERHFQVFLGLAPSSVIASSAARIKRRPTPAEEGNRGTMVMPEVRTEFFRYLTQNRRLADVTSAVVVADLDRMLDWMLRRLTMPPPPTAPSPSEAKPADSPLTTTLPTSTTAQPAQAPSLPQPPPPMPALPMDRAAVKRLLQTYPELGVEYVAMRRREGRQSSILPHLQAYLQLPLSQIKGPKRARVDSIISPQLREEFMKWLQEEKRLSAKCSKNYLGEISAMLKHLVQVVMPEEDVHQLLLEKEHVKNMITQYRSPQLEQLVDERRKAGKLRDAAVMWLHVFLGIKADTRCNARRPLISLSAKDGTAVLRPPPLLPTTAQHVIHEHASTEQQDRDEEEEGEEGGEDDRTHKKPRQEGETGSSDPISSSSSAPRPLASTPSAT